MERENNVLVSAATEATIQIVGTMAFVFAWVLAWQLRDPTSRLRLRLSELGDRIIELRDEWQRANVRREIDSLERALNEEG